MRAPDPTSTLQQAIDYVLRRRGEGTVCPCCTQHVQVYRRTITSQMARGLVALHLRTSKDMRGVPRKLEELAGTNGELVRVWRGDFTKLRHWGLIDGPKLTPEEQAEADKKDANLWFITRAGRDFARHLTTVSKYRHIFNNTVVEESGDQIDIVQALGKRFSYTELMKGASA